MSNHLSKFISLILRHNPAAVGITVDEFGWANVDALSKGINSKGHAIDRQILDEIVSSDNKGRYSYSEDNSLIRANQGHSIDVDLQLEPIQPPDLLYHGTATRLSSAIQEEGIKKMYRRFVHLSADVAIARIVGGRHGKPMIFVVSAKAMYQDGIKFFQSKNGVWLVDYVDTKYLIARQ